jgi:hypothetical protein
MTMADGGFRPAYNVQFASDTASHLTRLLGAASPG